MLLKWEPDEATATAADQFPLEVRSTVPARQFNGRGFNLFIWNHRVLQPAHWPSGDLVSDPERIIELFAAGHYLEALAMVVSWGAMWRQPDAIYGARELGEIRSALQACAASVQSSGSIGAAWLILTGYGVDRLGWSPVLSSKTLHFLCRAIGFDQNPPVPIDNEIILKRVWPAWRDTVPSHLRPRSWAGGSVDSYYRYMTAVLTWAGQRGWTTTQMESTMFRDYGAKERG